MSMSRRVEAMNGKRAGRESAGHPRRAALLLAVLSAGSVLVAGAPNAASQETGPRGAAGGPTTAEILEKFDRAQRETSTLVAGFTEEKNLRLLARSRVSRGRFYYNRPNQVRWEYDDPERKVYIITEDHYIAYFPAEKRAENVDLAKFVGKRVFRLLAVGQSSRDLAHSYDIARVVDGSLADAYLLVLTPRRERVRERLAMLRVWIDAGTFLPRRVAYDEPDGDSTVLTFHDPRPNIGLEERQFTIDLPKDVLVSSTYNGLSLGQGAF